MRTAGAILGLSLIAAACASACGGGAKGATSGASPEIPPDAPVVVAARAVCRTAANNPAARFASISGLDGAPSVVVDGTAYWFFGDTVVNRAGGGQDVIPSAVATSTDTDGSDCVQLKFKATGNRAEPLFPRADETTAWPDGILPLDDGSISFYMVKAIRTSPFAWHVGSVGLGRVAPHSTDGARLVETIWDENSGFGSRVGGVRSPVRVGNDVIVFISTDAGANYAAKVAIDRLGDAAAYRYWDGARWAVSPSDAQPMWTTPVNGFPADNGLSVTLDPTSGKWMALYNANLASVEVRFADAPQGPWSAPTTWIDCRPLVDDYYPYCYSAELHRELSADPHVLYMTFSAQHPYDVTLVELQLGVPVHRWRNAGGVERYATSQPGDGFDDAGVAFFASDRALPGFSSIYEHGTPNGYTYDTTPEQGTEAPAFYAETSACKGAVHTKPVYRWQRDGVEALDTSGRPGWLRGEVAFYVPAPEWHLADGPACGTTKN
jgi:hypothetical protein